MSREKYQGILEMMTSGDEQHQVSTGKRSGITNEPYRDGDKEYILRLIGQVITVSLETMKIVNALPDLGLPVLAKEKTSKAAN